MATKVFIKQFGGKVVGDVAYDTEGALVVSAYAPYLQAELEAIVGQIAQRLLTAVTGMQIEQNGQITHKTIARLVNPGEPRYLLALADALTHARVTIANKRIRAYVVTE
jgi:hypothetical protein